MSETGAPPPQSLLPYDDWTEQALRQVVLKAVQHAAANGLPGGHHFYITFRTDAPGVSIPERLRQQYPQEMTIVLQHQFWDLKVDEPAGAISVGLSFGGVASTLRIPLTAISVFHDPHVKYGMRFRANLTPAPAEPEPAEDAPPRGEEEGQVISLDAFRRRSPPRIVPDPENS